MKSKVGKFKASKITITDLLSLYDASDVESALAEVRTKLNIVNSDEILDCDGGVVVNDLVYLDSNEVLQKASNDDPTKGPIIGMVISKPTSITCQIMTNGEKSGFSGLTPGKVHYLGLNGSVTEDAPTTSGTTVIPIGVSKNSSTIIVLINNRGIINT